jgi:hypothetical protein
MNFLSSACEIFVGYISHTAPTNFMTKYYKDGEDIAVWGNVIEVMLWCGKLEIDPH